MKYCKKCKKYVKHLKKHIKKEHSEEIEQFSNEEFEELQKDPLKLLKLAESIAPHIDGYFREKMLLLFAFSSEDVDFDEAMKILETQNSLNYDEIMEIYFIKKRNIDRNSLSPDFCANMAKKIAIARARLCFRENVSELDISAGIRYFDWYLYPDKMRSMEVKQEQEVEEEFKKMQEIYEIISTVSKDPKIINKNIIDAWYLAGIFTKEFRDKMKKDEYLTRLEKAFILLEDGKIQEYITYIINLAKEMEKK
ncbi:MAG: hypothetical protein EAX96_06060 [Candidatus Lokiarchaeota archaeon]|nr:hypothetical protein [Candidatus Lokiarchaeota archaeon]